MAEEKEVVATETPVEKTEVAPKTDRKPGKFDKNGRGPRKFNKNSRFEKEYDERVVSINRVSKTVKGGRHMRFAALVVIGDGKGKYGYGTGKASEVPDAIKKGLEQAKRNMFKITIVEGDTISHEINGEFGACKVYLKPAPAGTGIVAGGPVRAVLELAGIKNIYSKVYGSRSPINCIRATTNGLSNLKTAAQVDALRK